MNIRNIGLVELLNMCTEAEKAMLRHVLLPTDDTYDIACDANEIADSENGSTTEGDYDPERSNEWLLEWAETRGAILKANEFNPTITLTAAFES